MGERIGGRYRLLERIGQGGSAAVWRAVDETTGAEVAVKRLHPHLVADAESRQRLAREARAATALAHPGIVVVRDIILDEDDPALVLDLVDGTSLAARLNAEPPVRRDEALTIARGVAEALAAAHEAGIVHRDVKPGNILLDGDGRPHLTDFGIAESGDVTVGLTAPGHLVGTLRYAAPERLDGEAATPASDTWGLGAVLYEMLAGRPAFPASSPAAVVASVNRPVEPIDGLDRPLAAVLETALQVDPAARYRDGSAMAAALARIDGVDPDADTAFLPVAAMAAAPAVSGPPAVAHPPPPEVPPIAPWPAPPAPEPSALQPAGADTTASPSPRLVGLAAVGLAALAVIAALAAGPRPPETPAAAAPSQRASTPSPSILATPSPTPQPKKDKDKGKGSDGGNGNGNSDGEGD
jgi:eukaryotic-like serine/threonine-protein kinase